MAEISLIRAKFVWLKLSVVIVNYNVKCYLEQCLCSVVKACARIDAEVFVVDNHSTDGSRDYFSHRFPDVHFRWSESNLGFAKANNSVLKELSGDLVLFLNPDTIVPEDCFEKCFHFFDTHPHCGALGVRMIDGAGKFLKESKRGFPSPATSLYKMIGLSTLLPRSPVFSRYYATHIPEHESDKVEVLAGAFMMLSREAIEKTGGFDEAFFMYAEDIDLSYRIQQAGFKNYYFPGTTIIHFKGESTQKKSVFYVKHFYGAMQLFIRKHYKERKLAYWLMTFAIFCSRQLASLRLFFATKKTPPIEGPGDAQSLLVVSTQLVFNQVLHLIKFATNPFVIHGRVAIDNNDHYPAIGKVDELERLLQKNPVQFVLYCEGELSFKKIITDLQQFGKQTGFLVHANGSKSIVGSNNKNRQGIAIADKRD